MRKFLENNKSKLKIHLIMATILSCIFVIGFIYYKKVKYAQYPLEQITNDDLIYLVISCIVFYLVAFLLSLVDKYKKSKKDK